MGDLKAIRIYGGTFWGCKNKGYLSLPDKKTRAKIRKKLAQILKLNGFSAIEVRFVNYGVDSGPGITIPLTESTLVIGAWPERRSRVEFFLHFCGEGKEEGAIQVGRELCKELEADCFVPSPLTLDGPAVFTYV